MIVLILIIFILVFIAVWLLMGIYQNTQTIIYLLKNIPYEKRRLIHTG